MLFALKKSVCVLVLCFAATGVSASALADDPAVAAARHELQRAEISYRLYRHVEYPRERRHLDAKIMLVAKEIEQLKVRVRECRRFERNRYSNPLLVSLQHAELQLLDAKLRRRNLEAEQRSAIRFHADRCRLHELEIEAAEARLAAL